MITKIFIVELLVVIFQFTLLLRMYFSEIFYLRDITKIIVL